jgi:hypothetical protein
MAKESNQYVIIQRKKKPNKAFLAFLGILGFVAIYVPFFGSNLRYMAGTTFKLIFNYLGNFCLIFGGALLAVNILKVFGKKISVKGFTVSVLFLWIGAFLTGAPFEIMGFLLGGNQPIQGYHFF